jgi:hypothetical protein
VVSSLDDVRSEGEIQSQRDAQHLYLKESPVKIPANSIVKSG